MSFPYRQVRWYAGLSLSLPLAFSLLPAQSPLGPASLIVGTWRGSSICVDPARDTACRNEEVIYEVDAAASATGPVQMRADKIVDGSRQAMGAFELRYDATTHAWSAELQTRLHVRWSFEPTGDRLAGTLSELPSGRLIRRVAARRAS